MLVAVGTVIGGATTTASGGADEAAAGTVAAGTKVGTATELDETGWTGANVNVVDDAAAGTKVGAATGLDETENAADDEIEFAVLDEAPELVAAELDVLEDLVALQGT